MVWTDGLHATYAVDKCGEWWGQVAAAVEESIAFYLCPCSPHRPVFDTHTPQFMRRCARFRSK